MVRGSEPLTVKKRKKPGAQQKRLRRDLKLLRALLGNLGEGLGALLGKQEEEEVGNRGGPIYY